MADAFNFFEITLNLATDGRLRICAKRSRSDGTEFLAGDFTSLDVFEEVLSKLAIALHGKKRPIALKVSGGRIVRDDSFKLPACNQMTAKAEAPATGGTTAKTPKAVKGRKAEASGAAAEYRQSKKKGARGKPREQ
jgi:hypothetical protein